MKSGQDDPRLTMACWHRDSQAQCLRIELANGNLHIVPCIQIVLVQFESATGSDSLSIHTTTHAYRIIGHNLRELALAFQKQAVDWIKEMPSRYNQLSVVGLAIISKIQVENPQEWQ